MRHTYLPLLSERPVPVLGIGGAQLTQPRADGEPMPRDAALELLQHSLSLGMTLVDTADCYGPDAARVADNEPLVGEGVRTWSGGRDAVHVITKIGMTRSPGPSGDVWGRNCSRDFLLRAAEASVGRLGFVPDAILLHRVNREQQPFERTIEAMLAVRDAGFAPRIGIGNVNVRECKTAWAVSGGAIAAVENERSPRYRGDTAALAWARERGVAYLTWSPFASHEAPDLPVLYPEFAAVAAELSTSMGRQVTAYQVTLAWLSAAGPNVIPLPSSTRKETATATAWAGDLVLSQEHVQRLEASPPGAGSLFPDSGEGWGDA